MLLLQGLVVLINQLRPSQGKDHQSFLYRVAVQLQGEIIGASLHAFLDVRRKYKFHIRKGFVTIASYFHMIFQPTESLGSRIFDFAATLFWCAFHSIQFLYQQKLLRFFLL